MGFEGFPKDLPDFLWGVALNNEKAWFEARRDTYERTLHGPIKALAEEVCGALCGRFPDLVLRYHVSRIYRDARTLNGRGPLNDHMWFSVGRTARVYESEPQFYFGIDARCCDWGLGWWSVTAADMQRWRERIDADPGRLLGIVKGLDRLEGCGLLADRYKRPKGDPGPELYPWYNAKRVVFGTTEWFEPDPPGAELAARLTEAFAGMTPLYRYMNELS